MGSDLADEINLTKCTVIKCTRSHSIISRDYILQDHVLENRTQSTYLGITLNNTLSWSSHINNIVSRATKTLNFLRHRLYKCLQEVKASAYFSIVHPLMEHANIVWDPYQITYINSLEGIQRRVARWATSEFSSASNLLESLKWPVLELHCKISRLSFFHKIIHNLSPVDVPSFFDIRPPLVYCLFPFPIFSKTEAGGR